MSGCQKETIANDNMISEITENIMIERGNINNKETINEKKNIENKEETIDEVNTDKIIADNKQQNEEKTIPKEDSHEQKEEVDQSNIDYQTHKGRIDCLTAEECINLSLPIQFELKDIIDSVFYLEVKTNSNKSLGYYIDYHFKEYQYEEYDTCIEKLNYLEQKIPDKINDYVCTDDGIFKKVGSEGDD